MISFARDSVTITEPGSRDDRGTAVADYDNPESIREVPRCSVQPGASDLDLAGRSSVGIRWSVFAPPGAVVSARAAVTYQGVRYLLESPAEVWKSPTGRVSHRVFRLVDFEG